MDDAMFLIPTPQVLQKIITGLEDLYTHDIADLDMQGDLYEYMPVSYTHLDVYKRQIQCCLRRL